MENFSPEQLEKWLAILGKPTLGVVAVIVLILYREAVVHFIKSAIDIMASWLKRHE